MYEYTTREIMQDLIMEILSDEYALDMEQVMVEATREALNTNFCKTVIRDAYEEWMDDIRKKIISEVEDNLEEEVKDVLDDTPW